jgi:diguanylate cyclase (GGDEF)-like protein
MMRRHSTVGTVIEMLRHERDTDALTGALNRRGFQAAVERLLTGSGYAPSSFVVFDLDKFKPVNDRYGHAASDQVLRNFGALLRASVRATDLVARIGGDEFAIYLNGLTHRDAAVVAQRIRTDLTGHRTRNFPGTEPITVSFGIATTTPGADFTSLLAAADDQLYQAKRAEDSPALALGSRAAAPCRKLRIPLRHLNRGQL